MYCLKRETKKFEKYILLYRKKTKTSIDNIFNSGFYESDKTASTVGCDVMMSTLVKSVERLPALGEGSVLPGYKGAR